MMASRRDLEGLRVTRPLLEADEYEDDEYDSYSWVLLEDHPLRSYPTEVDCHPEILSFTKKYYARLRRRWRERVLPLLCFVLMFIIVAQFLLQLPRIASYFLEPVMTEEIPVFIQLSTTAAADRWASHADSPSCVYGPSQQMEGATYNAVETALASGCTGVKVDLWLRNHDLLIGDSPVDLRASHTLQTVYLEPLQASLAAQNHPLNTRLNATEKHDGKPTTTTVGLFDEDPTQPFTLFLDIRTPTRRTAWTRLMAQQLSALNESGYLSYRDAKQDLVLRSVTVVVAERERIRLSLMDDLRRVMKGIF
ncbi:uncharacterized protein BJX67DRAFT_340292 [Aspergillus lucknowensis]|uniref:PLC-like phosphodiesterase n=1 Tax=Aspergillus lucknowensis TaxID=176173 RepID=A0ABR4M834_9EURO